MRQVVVETATKIVTHYFPEGGATIDDYGLKGPGVNSPNTKPDRFSIIGQAQECPSQFIGRYFTYDSGWSLIDQNSYDEALEEIQPVVLVPESVTRYQAKQALIDSGDFGAVESLVLDAGTPTEIRVGWTDAETWRRSAPFIETMRVSLGWSEQKIDDLFISAVQY